MSDSLPHGTADAGGARDAADSPRGGHAVARVDASTRDDASLIADEQRRRVTASACGFTGDDERARSYLEDPSPKVRGAALSALARLNAATVEETQHCLVDPSPIVRSAACELARSLPVVDRQPLLGDSDARVVEACAFALGELEDASATPALARTATTHDDPLCREAAVAALGAIGDARALDTLIRALEDTAQIRRRAVIALSNFDSDKARRAIEGRLDDRDWQVRQAAEDLLGVNAEERTSTQHRAH